MPESKNLKIPQAMRTVYTKITALIQDYCTKSLNQEYTDMASLVTAALCRKQPNPLLKGSIQAWACGILHAVGSINFLFDKSFPPYVSAQDLAHAFGVSTSYAGARSKQIRDALDMNYFDHRWMLPSRLEDSPIPWMISFNGFIVDVRTLDREIQEVAYQKGLIPYIYADKLPG
jgi:hypothetical protein